MKKWIAQAMLFYTPLPISLFYQPRKYHVLSQILIKKNCLLAPIPVGLLSIFSNIIFPVVKSIVNKSFEEACFPEQS